MLRGALIRVAVASIMVCFTAGCQTSAPVRTSLTEMTALASFAPGGSNDPRAAVLAVRQFHATDHEISVSVGYATRIEHGRFLTAAHVLDGDVGEIELGGEYVRYRAVAFDPARDIAVIDVEGGSVEAGPVLRIDFDARLAPGTRIRLLAPAGVDLPVPGALAVSNSAHSSRPDALVVAWGPRGQCVPQPGWSGLPLVADHNGVPTLVGVDSGSFSDGGTLYRLFARSPGLCADDAPITVSASASSP